ncbi:MAG: helix-turn-helix domain-containing protein [Xanthobacteraceae bacterium]
MANNTMREAMQNSFIIPFSQRVSCSIAEACQATGLGRTKLYEAISDGRIKSVKVGNRRLVIVASLFQLLGSTSENIECHS